MVREILYTQLFGVDINPAALGIAAFSLYLAALELDREPIADISDLKFDHLIGRTLFQADTIGGNLPSILTGRPFDAVVGNPPWTFVRDPDQRPRPPRRSASSPRPRRSPDHDFLAVASDLAGSDGRIGMVMKATPFFSKDRQAIEARSQLFKDLAPVALINLSFLRRESLFPRRKGPRAPFLRQVRAWDSG